LRDAVEKKSRILSMDQALAMNQRPRCGARAADSP
jgi:hypothetical protein